jgi:hypothetical protein
MYDYNHTKLTEITRIDLMLPSTNIKAFDGEDNIGCYFGRLKTEIPHYNGFDADISINIRYGTSANDAILLLRQAIKSLEYECPTNITSDDPDERIDWEFIVNIMQGVSIEALQKRINDPLYQKTDQTKWLYDKIEQLEQRIKLSEVK